MLRVRCVACVLIILSTMTVAAWNAADAKVGKGFVVGGIAPCTGLFKNVKLPRYAAGTVSLLNGPMSRTPEGAWRLPKHVVAKQTVRVNGTYRFAVVPGHYVLAARLAHSNAGGFLRVNVREGVTVHANIPNTCK
jgi:hypothetical protein